MKLTIITQNFCLYLLLFIPSWSFAQINNFWAIGVNPVGQSARIEKTEVVHAQLDLAGLKSILNNLPHHQEALSSTKLTFPDPHGDLKEFEIYPSSTMHPKLAAKYPDIKTYHGIGNSHNTLISIVTSPNKLSVVGWIDNNPYSIEKKDDNYVIQYENENAGSCGASTKNVSAESRVSRKSLLGARVESNTDITKSDGIKRTYRLAVSCTAEFGNLAIDDWEVSDQQKKADVMTAIVQAVNNLNLIYNRDFAVNFELVKDNDKIISFGDVRNDPWGEDEYDNSLDYLNTNESFINQKIGFDNYDIGHNLGYKSVDSWMGSSVDGEVNYYDLGFKPTLCTNDKARGFSTSWKILPHEVGHQFGATHTHLTCQQVNYSTAVEPGCGHSIMSYADGGRDFYHAVSITQILNTIKSSSCATEDKVSSDLPIVSAGDDVAIPQGTPFKLIGRLKEGKTANATYSWEQIDAVSKSDFEKLINGALTFLGEIRREDSPSSPSAKSGPLFTIQRPSTDPFRYIPQFGTIYNNDFDNNPFEPLPQAKRELNFALIVRDNDIAGGQVGIDERKISVSNSGPFKVTTPSSDVVVTHKNTLEVKWDVNGTNSSPVNCKKVNIKLINKDGTLIYSLLENTSNDGTAVVDLDKAQVFGFYKLMVEASDNIFFALSPGEIMINPVNLTEESLKPTIDRITSTSARISIIPPYENYTYKILIQYNDENNILKTLKEDEIKDTYTINNLSSSTNYQVTILAINNFGTTIPGAKNGSGSFMTTCSPPTLSATDVGKSTAKLEIKAAKNSSKSNVRIRAKGGNWSSIKNVDVMTNSITFTNLSSGTVYEVGATSDCLQTEDSGEVICTFTSPTCEQPTLTLPEGVTTTFSAHEDKISVPISLDKNSTAYQCRYQVKGSDSWSAYTESKESDLVIENLDAGTDYIIEVRSVCKVGDLGWPITFSIKTNSACPAVSNVSLQEVSDKSAIFNVVMAEFNYSDSLTLRYRKRGTSSWAYRGFHFNLSFPSSIWTTQIPGTLLHERTIELKSLNPGSEYEMQVKSSCMPNTSAYSDKINFLTHCIQPEITIDNSQGGKAIIKPTSSAQISGMYYILTKPDDGTYDRRGFLRANEHNEIEFNIEPGTYNVDLQIYCDPYIKPDNRPAISTSFTIYKCETPEVTYSNLGNGSILLRANTRNPIYGMYVSAIKLQGGVFIRNGFHTANKNNEVTVSNLVAGDYEAYVRFYCDKYTSVGDPNYPYIKINFHVTNCEVPPLTTINPQQGSVIFKAGTKNSLSGIYVSYQKKNNSSIKGSKFISANNQNEMKLSGLQAGEYTATVQFFCDGYTQGGDPDYPITTTTFKIYSCDAPEITYFNGNAGTVILNINTNNDLYGIYLSYTKPGTSIPVTGSSFKVMDSNHEVALSNLPPGEYNASARFFCDQFTYPSDENYPSTNFTFRVFACDRPDITTTNTIPGSVTIKANTTQYIPGIYLLYFQDDGPMTDGYFNLNKNHELTLEGLPAGNYTAVAQFFCDKFTYRADPSYPATKFNFTVERCAEPYNLDVETTSTSVTFKPVAYDVEYFTGMYLMINNTDTNLGIGGYYPLDDDNEVTLNLPEGNYTASIKYFCGSNYINQPGSTFNASKSFIIGESDTANLMSENTHVDNLFMLSPNPASKTVEITTTNTSGIKQILIYNLNGVRVSEQYTSTIDVHALSAGTYTITVNMNDGSSDTQRLIKEN